MTKSLLANVAPDISLVIALVIPAIIAGIITIVCIKRHQIEQLNPYVRQNVLSMTITVIFQLALLTLWLDHHMTTTDMGWLVGIAVAVHVIVLILDSLPNHKHADVQPAIVKLDIIQLSITVLITVVY